MSNPLVAVMPMDTQLDDAVRALQSAGIQDITFVALSTASGYPQLAGFAMQPGVIAVTQMLNPDTTVNVDGVGSLFVSGAGAGHTAQQAQDLDSFLRDALHYDSDDHGAALLQQLRDGHALLVVDSRHDEARSILQGHGAVGLH